MKIILERNMRMIELGWCGKKKMILIHVDTTSLLNQSCLGIYATSRMFGGILSCFDVRPFWSRVSWLFWWYVNKSSAVEHDLAHSERVLFWGSLFPASWRSRKADEVYIPVSDRRLKAKSYMLRVRVEEDTEVSVWHACGQTIQLLFTFFSLHPPT